MRKKTIEQHYAEFNKRNPHVLHELRLLAVKAFNAGRRRVGMKHLFEVLRWEKNLRTTDLTLVGDREFKLNNNFTALYARDIIARDPYLKPLFEVRKRAHEKANITISTPSFGVDNYLKEASD